MAQHKEMLHALKFVLEMNTISDVNFASDKEMCISVTGYMIYFMGIPIAW